MPRPALIAHHIIWTAYGTWLPNDPRGSTSKLVASDEIAKLGPHHFGRRTRQPTRELILEFYRAADEILKFPRVLLTPAEFDVVATGLANGIRENRYTCYAAAVLPDHVHLVIRKHRHQAEEMTVRLQGATRLALYERRRDLLDGDHPVWTSGGWNGFLSTVGRVRGTIHYVEQNPLKQGLPSQQWPFVVRYDNWPFHNRMRPPCPEPDERPGGRWRP